MAGRKQATPPDEPKSPAMKLYPSDMWPLVVHTFVLMMALLAVGFINFMTGYFEDHGWNAAGATAALTWLGEVIVRWVRNNQN